MNKYNYLDEITNDVKLWLVQEEPFDLSQFEERNDALDFLNDELWVIDSITGNGGQWYDSEEKCEEYLCHNIPLLFEALLEFGEFDESTLRTIYTHVKDHNFSRWADCVIRCYLLPQAIDEALSWFENLGFKYKDGD